jgi:hypothetical protein
MAVSLLLLVPALLAAQQPLRAEFGPIESITGNRLRAHLEFIAHDLLEGRDTPSRGLDIAAQYIVANLKLAGLKPAGDDGTYLQKVELRRPALVRENTKMTINGAALEGGTEFGAQSIAGGAFSGRMVFVDHGWVVPEWNVDPYKGIDVRGKVALVWGNIPRGKTFRELRQAQQRGAESPFEALAKRGATGIVTLLPASRTLPWSESPGMVSMVDRSRASSLPVVALSVDAAKKHLGSDANWSKIQAALDQEGGPEVPSVELSASAQGEVSVQENRQAFYNVVAIAEGADPRLKKEYVALGCHYDHIGTRASGEDRVFNGADDNGSGTVAMIEQAYAVGKGPRPKRSLLFVFHGGEEKGLWGSDYFTRNPTVPRENIVAQLNMDMIGRSATPGRTYRTVMTGENASHIIGESRLSREFGELVHDVNRRLYNLRYEKSHDLPNDPESLYSRSDHYNYARFNIPVAFWFSGIHEDYHQVGDHADKIDYVKLERIARTVLATAYAVGNRVARPKLD